MIDKTFVSKYVENDIKSSNTQPPCEDNYLTNLWRKNEIIDEWKTPLIGPVLLVAAYRLVQPFTVSRKPTYLT